VVGRRALRHWLARNSVHENTTNTGHRPRPGDRHVIYRAARRAASSQRGVATAGAASPPNERNMRATASAVGKSPGVPVDGLMAWRASACDHGGGGARGGTGASFAASRRPQNAAKALARLCARHLCVARLERKADVAPRVLARALLQKVAHIGQVVRGQPFDAVLSFGDAALERRWVFEDNGALAGLAQPLK